MPTLTWLTREEDLKAAGRAPYRLLEPVETYGDPNTENMLIQGDNLEALKALLPYYAGKVKCIYIDPPYNTKSAFESYDDNMEHTKWLETLYPRLELLRELLQNDGTIWMSIDDNEGHYLKVISDEIFGRKNFIVNIVWQKSYTANQTALHISDNHDHILLYAKNFQEAKINKIKRTDDQILKFKNPDNDPRGPWKAENLSAGKFYSQGQFQIIGPTGEAFLPPANRYWRCNEEQFNKWLADNRITFGLKGTGRPMLKKYLNEMDDALTPSSWWQHADYGSNKEASIDLKNIFSSNAFQTPKPEKLLSNIIHIATNPGDLVLDSFLGSGTTAAVAHKMGRRYIGVEIGDHAVTHCIPRLQKVIEGEQGGISQAVNWQGGGGFRFYRLGETVFDETGGIRAGIAYDHLAAHIFFSETGEPLHAPANAPLLGVHKDTAYYLLYNGVLGDKRPQSGNALTAKILAGLPPHDGPKMIYGERTLLSAARMAELQITFKHTPYDIKGR